MSDFDRAEVAVFPERFFGLIDGGERIRLAGHAQAVGVDLNVGHLDRKSGRQSLRDRHQRVQRRMSQVAADQSQPMIHLRDSGLQLRLGVGGLGFAKDRSGGGGDFCVDLAEPMKIGGHAQCEMKNAHAQQRGGEDSRGIERAEIAADASTKKEFALAEIDQMERLAGQLPEQHRDAR